MRLPLVKAVVRLHEHMSHCLAVCYDTELRANFNVTPPILNRFANGQSFQIVAIIDVATVK
jgi:hypothetical protein